MTKELSPVVLVLTPWESGPKGRVRQYIRMCIRDCLVREEIPWASHVMFAWTEALYDDDPEQRAEGLAVAKQMSKRCDLIAVYSDLGVTSGMREVLTFAAFQGKKIEHRKIYREAP